MGLLTNLLCLAVLPLLAKATFNQTPQSQVVILGETVILQCAIADSPGLFTYWLKGPDHISRNREILPGIGGENTRRYSIVGDKLHGEYFLKIVDVKVEDASEYRCAYLSRTSGSTSLPATIIVISPPKADFPVCLSMPDPGAHKPGSTVQLSCISVGGIPRANLTWTRDAVTLGNVTINNNKVTHVLTRNDNGVYFTCTATSPALRTPRTCTIMPMKIPPSPMIEGSANSTLVGDNFTASCHSDGIPAIGSYSWFIAGRPIDFTNPRFSAINHHLKIRNLRKKDNNAILTCMVTTTLGLTGNYSMVLIVEQPTTTALPTTATTIPTKTADTATGSLPKLDGEGNVGTGVNTKDHIDTSVTRYNMKLILALIFGMLIFIFIIVLMTLTYFFASHTTRPRQKESGYEDTTLGPVSHRNSFIYMPALHQGENGQIIHQSMASDENSSGYISQLYASLEKPKHHLNKSQSVSALHNKHMNSALSPSPSVVTLPVNTPGGGRKEYRSFNKVHYTKQPLRYSTHVDAPFTIPDDGMVTFHPLRRNTMDSHASTSAMANIGAYSIRRGTGYANVRRHDNYGNFEMDYVPNEDIYANRTIDEYRTNQISDDFPPPPPYVADEQPQPNPFLPD